MRMFILIATFMMLVSCGSDAPYEPTPTPTPTPTPIPGTQLTWDDVKTKVAGNCGNCHNGIVQPLNLNSAATFKQAKVLKRINEGSMPPAPRTLNGDDKALLVKYLSQS